MKRLLACSVLTLICWTCNYPGSKKPGPVDPAVPVEEKGLISLGGTKQYVEISGLSDKNPVLLFIHGGPGWPQTPMLRYFNADLTKTFIVATWDQRGCGLSFLNDSLAQNVTLDQMVADGHELTQLLKNKFEKQKIFLAGFSWGSVIGLTLAHQYPEDYIAYIGISQVVNLKQGMEITQKWLFEKATEKKDFATLGILKGLREGDRSICISPLDCFTKQYELVAQYRGAVYNPRSDTAVASAMAHYVDYKNYDWNKGFYYSARLLEKDMFSVDFSNISRIDIPVYFISGRHDWNVPSVLAETLFKNIQAPHKEMIWFEQSGHGPLEEEPEKFNNILVEKLSGYK
jgi:pimeloyl-ACP methyl ester carboxylesterase